MKQMGSNGINDAEFSIKAESIQENIKRRNKTNPQRSGEQTGIPNAGWTPQKGTKINKRISYWLFFEISTDFII